MRAPVLEIQGLTVRYARASRRGRSISRSGRARSWGSWGIGRGQVDRRARRRPPPARSRGASSRGDPPRGPRPPGPVRGRDAAPPRRRRRAHPAGPALRAQPRLPDRAPGDGRARIHRGLSREAAAAEMVRLLGHLGLPEPAEVLRRYPHELSGACGSACSSPWPFLRPHARHRGRADHGARRHHAGPDPAAPCEPPGGDRGSRRSSSPTISAWWRTWRIASP